MQSRRGRGAAVLVSVIGLMGCPMTPAASTADLGQQHYDNYCGPCHGEAAHGNPDIAAPAVAGLPVWYIEEQLHKFRQGSRGAHFDDAEGLRMRPMAMALRSENAVGEVAAYVAGLPPAKPASTFSADAANGAKLYATCAACHGENGAGNEQLHSPPLTGTHDWYLVSQLKKIKDGVRGSDPRDTWGATMVPMAMSLEDEKAMKDVVAHIQTLRR
ncbi:MAG: c-type cytochrome [Myxococcales bacterium]|nr:c-type cytochrome [Myxococcales bacterium]